jgi:hypothetical protein
MKKTCKNNNKKCNFFLNCFLFNKTIFLNHLFFQNLKKYFLFQKYFFVVIQGAKNIIQIKISAKRFEPPTSWSPSFYSTAAPLTLRHFTLLVIIQIVCGGHFRFIFFSAKGGRVRTKEKKYVSNEIN